MVLNGVPGISERLARVARLVACIERSETNGERETEDLEIEIGVGSLWSLTRNAKLYYFHLDFKRFEIHEAWNAPLFSSSVPLYRLPLLRAPFLCRPLLSPPFLAFRRRGSNSGVVYWCCQFNFPPRRTIVGRKGGCSRGRGAPVSLFNRPLLSLAIVHVTAPDIWTSRAFFLPLRGKLSPVFVTAASFDGWTSFSRFVWRHWTHTPPFCLCFIQGGI